MLYELLLFFGLFNPEAASLDPSDIKKISVELSEAQIDKMLDILKSNPAKKDALFKYLESIDVDTRSEVFKLILRFKK